MAIRPETRAPLRDDLAVDTTAVGPPEAVHTRKDWEEKE